jgi:hypothetical protein
MFNNSENDQGDAENHDPQSAACTGQGQTANEGQKRSHEQNASVNPLTGSHHHHDNKMNLNEGNKDRTYTHSDELHDRMCAPRHYGSCSHDNRVVNEDEAYNMEKQPLLEKSKIMV